MTDIKETIIKSFLLHHYIYRSEKRRDEIMNDYVRRFPLCFLAIVQDKALTTNDTIAKRFIWSMTEFS